mgnify:CR=1 FL=1
MAETKTTKTMLATENKQEATEVMAFLAELTEEEKKYFLMFVQGIRFKKDMKQNVTPKTA